MQVSDEIIEVLEYLCSKFELAIDWTGSNVLPYVNQLCEKFVNWKIATSFAWIVITIIVAIIISYVCKCANLHKEEKFILYCCILCVVVAIIVAQIFNVIECSTFPEKVVFDYIRTNIKIR